MKSAIKDLTPAPVLRWHTARTSLRIAAQRQADAPEIAILRDICPRGCVALDIGANQGIFTVHLLRIARRVHAFEPNPELAQKLRDATRFRRVHVHEVALSDRSGAAHLRIPVMDKQLHGLATIEDDNDLQGMDTVHYRVPTAQLDGFDLPRVGFVKIDVEGHEAAVLDGMWRLIEQDHPAMLIEASDRHRPGAVASVVRRMQEHGYCHRSFLWGRKLVPLSEFDPAIHQAPGSLDRIGRHLGECAENFVFQ